MVVGMILRVRNVKSPRLFHLLQGRGMRMTPTANVWGRHERVQAAHPSRFAMQQIVEPGDIYPVFRKLFRKRVAS